MSIEKNKYATEVPAVIVVIIAYGYSLSGGFIGDDWAMIVNNADKMTGSDAIARFFRTGVWQSSNHPFEDASLYRPVWLLWHFLVYQVAGENAFVWRVSNLALHALNIVLVIRLAGTIFPATDRVERMLAGLLFGLHPALTHNVALITGSTDILMTTFALGTILFFIKARTQNKPSCLVASFLCYGAAVLSKEPAIVLPLIALAWDLCLPRGDNKPAGSRYSPYGVFLVIAGLYLFARSHALNGGLGSFTLDNTGVLRSFEYIVRYAGMAAAPWPLPFYIRHPAQSFLSDPQVIHQMILGAAITGLMVLALLRGKQARFAVIWMMMGIAAPLALALHDKGVFGPKFLYLPLVGFVLLVLAGYLWLKQRFAKAQPAALIVSVVIAGSLSLVELPNWQNQMTWGDKMIATSAELKHGWTAKAEYLISTGQTEALKTHYRKAYEAVEENENKAIFAENLAILHANDNDFESSREAYTWITNIKGFETNGYIGLGNIAWVSNRPMEAIKAYQQALEHSPENFMALYNIARLSESRKDTKTALRYYSRVLKIPAPEQYAQALIYARNFVLRYGSPAEQ